MSTMDESRQVKMIGELRGFIKKTLADPTIPQRCMEIARRYKNDPDGDLKMAQEISATTTIRIPDDQSDADRMFIEILREVLDDEAALY